jgi:[ribosomal protein S5]-alanine N-acetyltransferase
MHNKQREQISLRRFTMDDTRKIFEMSQEESLGRYLPDQVYQNYDEASNVLAFLIRSSEEIYAERHPYVLGVTLNRNELIGHVGASAIDEGIEIGYAIETKHQGFGYAQKAVAQMLQLLEMKTNIREIYGIVDPENEASKKVLERCGFLKVGTRGYKIIYRRFLIQ